MKIKIEVDIFDDAEYCENEDTCEYAISAAMYCMLFNKNIDMSGIRLDKCDECKAAYQHAKSAIKQTDELPEGHYPDGVTHLYK